MAERVIGLRDISELMPTEPWIVVFGGVTREGNRRARRAIKAALESELSVVWFDGFSEGWGQGQSPDRVLLDVPVPEGSVIVIDYETEERGHWFTRIVEGVPSAAVRPLERAEDRIAAPGTTRVPVLTPMRRLVQKVVELLHRKVLRRFFLVFRGVVGWRIVRDGVKLLSTSSSPPRQIIYGDDFSLTIGWHAARLWPDVRTSTEFVGK